MWEIFLREQSLTFVFAIVLGFFFCILFDLFSFIRCMKKTSNFMVMVSDLVFWLIVTFVTFLFLLSRTNGEVRGYVLAGELIGFVFWRLTVSRLLFPFFKNIFCISGRFFHRFNMKKTAFLIHLSESLCLFFLKFCKTLKKLAEIIKKLLKKGYRLLYTKSKSKKINCGE